MRAKPIIQSLKPKFCKVPPDSGATMKMQIQAGCNESRIDTKYAACNKFSQRIVRQVASSEQIAADDKKTSTANMPNVMFAPREMKGSLLKFPSIICGAWEKITANATAAQKKRS